jgi:hypothetical protein
MSKINRHSSQLTTNSNTILWDRKPINTGPAATGVVDWVTLSNIQYTRYNNNGITVGSDGSFFLQGGFKYSIEFICNLYKTDTSKIILYNVTDSSIEILGQSFYMDPSADNHQTVFLMGDIDLTAVSEDVYHEYQFKFYSGSVLAVPGPPPSNKQSMAEVYSIARINKITTSNSVNNYRKVGKGVTVCNEKDRIIFADATDGDVTIYLPVVFTPGSMRTTKGSSYRVKRLDSSGNNITVMCDGGPTWMNESKNGGSFGPNDNVAKYLCEFKGELYAACSSGNLMKWVGGNFWKYIVKDAEILVQDGTYMYCKDRSDSKVYSSTDGSTWTNLGYGATGTTCIEIFGGVIHEGSNNSHWYRWDSGTTWIDLGVNGGVGTTDTVFSTVYDNKIWCACDNEHIYTWDGAVWADTGLIPSGTIGSDGCFFVYDGVLYIAQGGILKYEGGAWVRTLTSDATSAISFTDGGKVYIGSVNNYYGYGVFSVEDGFDSRDYLFNIPFRTASAVPSGLSMDTAGGLYFDGEYFMGVETGACNIVRLSRSQIDEASSVSITGVNEEYEFTFDGSQYRVTDHFNLSLH